VEPREHAWRPLWLSPAAMLAAEMLAQAVTMPVDELVDAVLLELLDQRYRSERGRRGPGKDLHPAPAVQPRPARVIPFAQSRRKRAQAGGG
jgi:hypothetical protein